MTENCSAITTTTNACVRCVADEANNLNDIAIKLLTSVIELSETSAG